MYVCTLLLLLQNLFVSRKLKLKLIRRAAIAPKTKGSKLIVSIIGRRTEQNP